MTKLTTHDQNSEIKKSWAHPDKGQGHSRTLNFTLSPQYQLSILYLRFDTCQEDEIQHACLTYNKNIMYFFLFQL